MHPDIAAAADDNFVQHATWVQRATPGMLVMSDESLTVVDSGLPTDTFNFVCRARLAVHNARERVQAAIRHFREVERPFSWWVGPADQPDNLAAILTAGGLQPAESELAMAVELAKLVAPDPVSGVAIRCVDSQRALEAYSRILSGLATPPDMHVETFFTRAASRLLVPDSPVKCYVAYLGEQAVGTVEMTLGGGVAGLYNVATVEAYRRRGIGSMLTVHPLMEARENGLTLGVLQAAADGPAFPTASHTRAGSRHGRALHLVSTRVNPPCM